MPLDYTSLWQNSFVIQVIVEGWTHFCRTFCLDWLDGGPVKAAPYPHVFTDGTHSKDIRLRGYLYVLNL